MKDLLDFIVFLIVVFLFYFLFSGIKIHTIDETDITPDYRVKDMVYILPDSTVGMIQSGYVLTKRHRDELTKVKTHRIIDQIYTVVYTDKNGVVQKLKNIDSELLVKKNK